MKRMYHVPVKQVFAESVHLPLDIDFWNDQSGAMPEKFPRSPYDSVQGLVYFPRMLDKIRLHAAGELPPDHQEHLGSGFDGRCLRLLHVEYEALRRKVLAAGASDEELLEWCFQNGRRLTEEEIETWSGFMIKRGWRDDAFERVASRVKEAGMDPWPAKLVTMFDFIDLDEDRIPPDFRASEAPGK